MDIGGKTSFCDSRPSDIVSILTSHNEKRIQAPICSFDKPEDGSSGSNLAEVSVFSLHCLTRSATLPACFLSVSIAFWDDLCIMLSLTVVLVTAGSLILSDLCATISFLLW